MFREVAAKALVIWFVILVLAMINGLLRGKVFVPILGALPGMVLSGALLCCLIFSVTFILLPWLGARRPVQFMFIGIGWLVLTIVFEFSFGWWRGQTPAEMLEAYLFQGGNIWPVVLLFTAVSPWLAAKFRGWA